TSGHGSSRNRRCGRLSACLCGKLRHHDLGCTANGRTSGRAAHLGGTRMSTKLFLQDVTLRDGMHAIRHRISPKDVGLIAAALDASGVDAIEVAHGDGLAGTSVNYGPASNTDWEWIEAAAANVTNARLTTLLLPGVGTIAQLQQAYELGVRSVRIATHCTEADVSAQHISTARELGMDVAGFLMMSHLQDPVGLATQAKLMESY